MGEIVLITGAAKRIGRALALTFAEAGYDIALHYNTSLKEAESTSKEIKATGVACEVFHADLSSSEESSSLIRRVIEGMSSVGHLRGLVNSASVFEPCTLEETSLAFFEAMYSVNFMAPFLLSQYFKSATEDGFIINFLDTNISSNTSTHAAYLLAKKNLAELTKMAALEWAPGIRVNGISPGATLPPPGKDQSHLDRVISQVPSKKQVELKNITQAALLLAHSSDITGQILNLDGGEHL